MKINNLLSHFQQTVQICRSQLSSFSSKTIATVALAAIGLLVLVFSTFFSRRGGAILPPYKSKEESKALPIDDFKVLVKDLANREQEIVVTSDMPILKLKEICAQKFGIQKEQIELQHHSSVESRTMLTEDKISDYAISPGTHLFLALRLPKA